MEQQILQLRLKDRVRIRQKQAREVTDPHSHSFLTSSANDGLIHLLEGADAANCPSHVKFYSRTFFIGLVLNGEDGSNNEDIMNSNIKSSFYHAYQVCSNPQEFDAFLFSESIQGIMPHILSSQHQQIQQQIFQLTGSNFIMSTPYEFASVVKNEVGFFNFERTIGYIIDFALTIPETSKLTSEEIFVGCCLVMWEQHNLTSLGNLLMTYFQSTLVRGWQLSAAIQAQLHQSLNSQA